MGWAEFYSQGSFTGDQDLADYAVAVGLYGLIPVLLPLAIGIAALVVHKTGKATLTARWRLGLLLLPVVGLLVWAIVESSTASPIKALNDGIVPLKVSSPPCSAVATPHLHAGVGTRCT